MSDQEFEKARHKEFETYEKGLFCVDSFFRGARWGRSYGQREVLESLESVEYKDLVNKLSTLEFWVQSTGRALEAFQKRFGGGE